MPQFHPPEEWLIDYSSGNLTGAHALCVATHLEYCPCCRAKVQQLNQLGAGLFGELSSAPVNADLKSRVLSAISPEADNHERINHDANGSDAIDNSQLAFAREHQPLQTYSVAPESEKAYTPQALKKLLKNSAAVSGWKKLGKNLQVFRLSLGDRQKEVALHKISAGGTVAEHTHRGDEVTVVISGSFSDDGGVYQKGDFLLRGPDDVHRPMVTQDDECICLSVLDAPVKFTGLMRFINPFLRINPI